LIERLTWAFKGRVRFPKRTRRRSCRDSDRTESAEFLIFFWKGGALQRDAEVESF
jgi:hypothetical protein